ncbi:MAG: 30S ribosomal protein S4 [Pirellulaceae bacterium]
MARTTGSVCRLCRRDGLKLFLKGNRCDTPKCAYERRPVPPGMVQAKRSKGTDYGLRLREKQKLKHYYGILERQFRRYFAEAQRSLNTADALLTLVERRLDNIVHRLGFGLSRAAARQLVAHGHITVNGHRCDIPSYLVRVGDVIRVKNRAKSLNTVKSAMAESHRQVPDFLQVIDGEIPEGHIRRLPEPFDVSIPVQTQLIVEICSR